MTTDKLEALERLAGSWDALATNGRPTDDERHLLHACAKDLRTTLAAIRAEMGGVTDAMVERACIAAAREADKDSPWSTYSVLEKGVCRRAVRAALTAALNPTTGEGEQDAIHVR